MALVTLAVPVSGGENTEAEAREMLESLAGRWEIVVVAPGGEEISYGVMTMSIQDGVLISTASDHPEKTIYEYYKKGGYIRKIGIRRASADRVTTAVFKCHWDPGAREISVYWPKPDGMGFKEKPMYRYIVGEDEVKIVNVAAGKPNGTVWRRRRSDG